MNLTSFAGVARRFTDPVTGEVLIPPSTVRGWADANRDGFADQCVVRLPGKRLVDLDAMDEWLEGLRGLRKPVQVDDEDLELQGGDRDLPPFEEVWAKSSRTEPETPSEDS